ncbi:DUF1609 domain-containing protein, partial [Encephalitozoon intestinalis]
MIWIHLVELLGLINVVWSSLEIGIEDIERRIGRKMNDAERKAGREVFENSPKILNYRKVILYPFAIHDNSFLVFPTTKYSEIEEGKREHVKKIIEGLPRLTLWCMGFLNVPFCRESTMMLSDEVLQKSGLYKHFDSLSKKYEEDKMTFGDLAKKILEGCKGTLEELGKLFVSKASEEIRKLKDLPNPDSEENKKKKEEFKEIKKHGELICNKREEKQIFEVLNMAYDRCLSLWEREEYRENFIMKMRLKKLYVKEIKMEIKEPLSDYANNQISSIGYLDHDLLIKIDREHGGEAVGELMKETFLEYKSDYKNEINRAVLEVEERKRREEKEKRKEKRKEKEEKERKEKKANQNAEELIREEEEEKRRRNQKGKSKVGEKKEVKKKTVTKDKKEEIEDKESEKGAVGGKKKEKTEKKNYKIHGRVFRWKKEPKVIKNSLDKGTEKKWRGQSIEEIKEQKKFHDIVEVVGLLKDEDPDDFFSLARSYEERGVKKERKVALAMLETKDSEKEIGIVEVGIFKDGGNDVIYHLIFKPVKEEEIKEAVNSVFAREEDGMDEIDKKNIVDIEKMENEERNEEASKFKL